MFATTDQLTGRQHVRKDGGRGAAILSFTKSTIAQSESLRLNVSGRNSSPATNVMTATVTGYHRP